MSRTLHFMVTMPDIPDGMADQTVLDWVRDEISHPHDAYYDASIEVVPYSLVEYANPERDGNGCMIFQEQAKE